ncbi:V-set and immunoglobulin domain-containing protein 4-like [Acipenser ruthenus]|uniref:V-set and immunoglobulin domain-containing protein 4-like n=1 Tax=Acipenser ruthenus TaxID=7906 RepID=UPI0027429CE6|nr:V-set and immunoglobulin domain-containing protein 4-like [Acipenser ruthenus]
MELLFVFILPLAFSASGVDANKNLSAVPSITAVLGRDVTIPCTYQLSPGYSEVSLKWTMRKDGDTKTLLYRDRLSYSIPLSMYRSRVSIPSTDQVGNVSLTLKEMYFQDRADYMCEVTWRNGSENTVQDTALIKVSVVQVPVSKPFMPNVQSPLYIQAGQSISLTCTAAGSLPITYMWYKKKSDGTKTRLSRQAALTVSDAGTYYCEAENYASGKKVEKSDPIELIVQEWIEATSEDYTYQSTTEVKNIPTSTSYIETSSTEPVKNIPTSTSYIETSSTEPGGNAVSPASRQKGNRTLLWLYILIAALCIVVLFAVIIANVIMKKRKKKRNANDLNVTFSSHLAGANNNMEDKKYAARENEYEAMICKNENEYAAMTTDRAS